MAYEYNKLFKPGTRLILELRSKDIYEGIYIDGGKDRIVLNDVIQHNNKNKLSDLYEFYRNEIANVHTLKLPASQNTSKFEQIQENNCKLIKMCEEDYFRLKDMSKNYIYIDIVDKKYFDAIDILKNSETIGVVSLGMENNRLGSSIKLLVLCTWKQTYIFDLIGVEKRELYPGIKELFESEYICKVMHKSAGLVDILFRHYNVYIQNIFDTQIVDLIIQRKKIGSCPPNEQNLSECLVNYLNFPPSLLEHALEVSNKKWNERPLSDKLKLYASQLATYLIVLKEEFNKILLKNVFDTINKIQDRVYDFDDFEYSNYMTKNEVPEDIQKLIGNLNIKQ